MECTAMAIKWDDIKHKNSPERRAATRQAAKAELERLGFGKLRQARQLTQVQLAERLDVPQAAISRMERRTDLLLSTLRPVSYTHLDVYKRQRNVVADREGHRFLVGRIRGHYVVCLLYTSRCV